MKGEHKTDNQTSQDGHKTGAPVQFFYGGDLDLLPRPGSLEYKILNNNELAIFTVKDPSKKVPIDWHILPD